MSLNIPQNFPDSCSPEQINSTIRDILDLVLKEPLDIHQVQRNTPLITLGHSELDRRESANVIKQSKRLGRISIAVAILALAIAGYGSVSSAEWQNQQIEILSRIGDNTNIDDHLSSQSALFEKIEAHASSEATCVLKSSESEIAETREETD